MEKQTVFIKRYPSKGELPKTAGYYDTNVGRVFYFGRPKKYYPEWFLEEIELPSEEEVKAELAHPANISENISTLLRDMYEHGLNRAYKFIINHLKSDTNG